jgi:hypothetical protein
MQQIVYNQWCSLDFRPMGPTAKLDSSATLTLKKVNLLKTKDRLFGLLKYCDLDEWPSIPSRSAYNFPQSIMAAL